MKNSYLIGGLLSFVLLLACTPKTSQVSTSEPDIKEKEEEAVLVDKDSTEIDNPEPAPYVMVRIKRTPCFGRCPSFDAKFYSDGTATYYGKKFAPRQGKYKATVERETLKEIIRKAQDLGFFDMDRYYPDKDKRVLDLPLCITYVNTVTQEHTTENNFDAPLALIEFERYLEAVIETLSWTEGDFPKD